MVVCSIDHLVGAGFVGVTIECMNLGIHYVCEAGISNLDNSEELLRNFLGYGGEYWNRLEKWQTRLAIMINRQASVRIR